MEPGKPNNKTGKEQPRERPFEGVVVRPIKGYGSISHHLYNLLNSCITHLNQR